MSSRRLSMFVAVLLVFAAVSHESWWLTAVPRAAADVTVGPIGTALADLGALATRLEQSGHSLIDHGNAAFGQQLQTLAATLRGVIREIEANYSSALNKTADKFTTEEMNVRNSLQGFVETLGSEIPKTSAELQARLYQIQNASNQLLDKTLPMTSRRPLLYAAQARDVLAAFSPSPRDIVVLGYLLADPELNYRKPDVWIDGETVPADHITVVEGRLEVQLPDSIRKMVRIANPPCSPMRTFVLSVRSYYMPRGGFLTSVWKGIGWPSKADLGFRLAPGTRAYDIEVTAEGSRLAEKLNEPIAFAISSGQANFGCEQTVPASIPNQTFPGRILPGLTGNWTNMSNVKTHGHNVQRPDDFTFNATGSITGLDYKRYSLGLGSVAECPGGGHGELVVSGQYATTRKESEAMTYAAKATMYGRHVPIALLSEEGLKWKTVVVRIRRHGCNQILDQVVIPGPNDPNQLAQTTSERGYYTCSLQRSDLRITIADRLRELE